MNLAKDLTPKEPFFSNRAYDIATHVVSIVLPASATLYFGLATIWDLPRAQEVVGTIALITTFLGVCLGISKRAYNRSDARFDGNVVVSTTESGGMLYSLELKDDPEELKDKKELSFKVVVTPVV